MAVSSNQSGTQTATINTEHTLGTAITSPGTYILDVDTTNMVNGDVLELRAYKKVLTGDAADLLALVATYSNTQSDVVKFSIPIPSVYSCHFTLKQTAGTGRNFNWNILAL